MDLLNYLSIGFGVALQPTNLFYCFAGGCIGTLVGGVPPLGAPAFGSFMAVTLATLGLMLVAPPLSRFALKFGPPEYFTLMVLGLTILIYLAHGSMPKALLMACFGIVLGLIGLDSINARPLLTFEKVGLMRSEEHTAELPSHL